MLDRLPPALRDEIASLPPAEQTALARVWALTEQAAPPAPPFALPAYDTVKPRLAGAPWRAFRAPVARTAARTGTWAKMGALLGVAALGTMAVLYWPAAPSTPAAVAVVEAAAPGERDAVRLADGSNVVLNGSTRLEGRVGDTREVTLTGEAFFDVAPDPARPFVIEASGVRVEVIGTAFNVRAYPGRPVEVSVERGRVAVVRGAARVELGAGESVVATGAMTPRPAEAHAGAWRTGGFYVTDAPLSEIATEIERRYGTRLVLDDALRARRWTLGVPDAPNDTLVLDALASGLGLKVVRGADGVRLSK